MKTFKIDQCWQSMFPDLLIARIWLFQNDKMALAKQIEQLSTERENLLHELDNAKHNASTAK